MSRSRSTTWEVIKLVVMFTGVMYVLSFIISNLMP